MKRPRGAGSPTPRQRPPWVWPAVFGALLIGAGAYWVGRQSPAPPGIEVQVPRLTEMAKAGRLAFDRRCAACHGPHAGGTAQGPPLVHRIYEPSHHGDVAFQLAVRRGVRAHHWRFGDMPPQPAVSADEVTWIVRYVRELQEANGIR